MIDWTKPVPKFGRILVAVLVLVLGARYALNRAGVKPSSETSGTSGTTSTSRSPLSGLTTMFSGSKPLTVCTNTWGGYAAMYYYNGGNTPSKDSRFYKEQGVQVGYVNIDPLGESRDAWKSDSCQVLWVTVDSFPTESADLAGLKPKIFVQYDWSRGGDVVIGSASVRSVRDLRGKRVAAATGSPSMTLLAKLLEAGGLRYSDIEFIGTDSAPQAAELFRAGKVDVAVVWSPDDQDALKAVPGSRVLMSTKDVPYAIADVLYAKESVINERREELVGFTAGVLTASAELNASPSVRKQAAAILAKAMKQDVGFMEGAVENVRFTTYGDNLSFFEMTGTSRGSVTGQELYNQMGATFAELGLAPNSLPSWRSLTDTSILEAVGLKLKATGDQAAEGAFKFSAPTPAEANAEAFATKHLTVNFATDSAELDLVAKKTIDNALAGTAKSFASVRARIVGNTDNTGSAVHNRELSERRAHAVAEYLVRTYGFDENRFTSRGDGPDNPVTPNTTAEGRAQNRRTDFELTK